MFTALRHAFRNYNKEELAAQDEASKNLYVEWYLVGYNEEPDANTPIVKKINGEIIFDDNFVTTEDYTSYVNDGLIGGTVKYLMPIPIFYKDNSLKGFNSTESMYAEIQRYRDLGIYKIGDCTDVLTKGK